MPNLVDLGVNNRNRFSTGPGGAIIEITDREVFEQAVGLALAIKYERIIGDADPNEIRARLKMAAKSVAKNDPNIQRMPVFEVDVSRASRGEISVTILYDTGEVAEFTI